MYLHDMFSKKTNDKQNIQFINKLSLDLIKFESNNSITSTNESEKMNKRVNLSLIKFIRKNKSTHSND